MLFGFLILIVLINGCGMDPKIKECIDECRNPAYPDKDDWEEACRKSLALNGEEAFDKSVEECKTRNLENE